MTGAASNRFTQMFEKTGVTERKKPKKMIDFGESMAGDEGINATFRALHETVSSSNVFVPPVSVAEPVVKPVVVDTPIVKPVAAKTTPLVTIVPAIESVSSQSVNEERPLDRLSTRPLDGYTVSPSDSITVLPINSDTVLQSNRNTVTPSDDDTVTLSRVQGVSGQHPQTVSQYKTHHQTPMHYVPLDVLNLAYNQACVLECLIANTSGVTNARTISDNTHITIPSVREALLRLAAKGFMHKPVTVRDATFQGFSYVLNKALCDHFINAGGLSQDNYLSHQTPPETLRRFESMTVRPSNSVTTHSSREFYQELKPTTTSSPETVTGSDQETLKPPNHQTITPSNGETMRPSDSFILTGAVGAYWEGEGLGEGQAQKWCQQFEVAPNQMRQQLDWARFDLETNNRRESVTKDPVSWFFGHLRTTAGCFPRPVNYRSPLEIRAEALQQQQERDKEAKSQLETADFENRFQAFLADPDAPLYHELLNQVNGFALDQLKSGDRMAAEIELRELFKKTRSL
jgi:hypothetical protein